MGAELPEINSDTVFDFIRSLEKWFADRGASLSRAELTYNPFERRRVGFLGPVKFEGSLMVEFVASDSEVFSETVREEFDQRGLGLVATSISSAHGTIMTFQAYSR